MIYLTRRWSKNAVQMRADGYPLLKQTCPAALGRPAPRDSFRNLLLLCHPHHAEMDDSTTAEELYPAERLRRWKTQHEAQDEQVLAQVHVSSGAVLPEHLVKVFTPSPDWLEMLMDRVERTGETIAETLGASCAEGRP